MYAREVVGFVIVLLSAICYGSITTFATIAYRSGLLVEHLVISRGIVVSILCCAIAIAFRQPMEVGKFRLFPVFFFLPTRCSAVYFCWFNCDPIFHIPNLGFNFQCDL